MKNIADYKDSVAFLRGMDTDWNRLVMAVGPCLHDSKAAREPYEALVRAIAYQQLTARAGDANINRLKALFPLSPFPTPEDILSANADDLRACGFSVSKASTITAIARGTLSGLIPSGELAAKMGDGEIIDRLTAIKGIGLVDRGNAAHVFA